jgi:acyl-coenzyme A synthetase/AMP-(fatty) acid ligase
VAFDVWSRFVEVAAERPDAPAFLTPDDVVSFARIERAAGHAAEALAAAGLGPGDRCVAWADNSLELAVSLLGILALGAIPTLVYADAPAGHFRHAAQTVGARLAIVDEALAASAELEGETLLVGTVGAVDREGAPRVRPAKVHGREPASILFTSGSTGLPKGVCQSHENLLWGADAVAGALGLGADDRILSAIPWAFDYGWGQLLSTFLRGAAQVLPPSRNPFGLCSAIERSRPTVLPSVPSLAASLIRGVTPIRDTDLGSIRLVTNTGSKIPESLYAELLEAFPRAAVSLNYGLTETYRSASLPFDLARTHPASVGRPVAGAALVVLREDGSEAAPGETGEIVHRGCGVFLGYWGDAQRTAEVRRPDPLRPHAGVETAMAVFTGDLGWRDDEGLLYVKGRRDRQIKSMGVRVSPDEVEQLICASGLVAEAAVLSRPHEMMGEMVVAVVAPGHPGEGLVARLKACARASMSPFMRPMEWNLVEALPRTPNGKVDYPALRRLYAGEATP